MAAVIIAWCVPMGGLAYAGGVVGGVPGFVGALVLSAFLSFIIGTIAAPWIMEPRR